MLYLFNTAIITTPGLTYTSEVISAEVARRYVKNRPFTSAIGHASTAEIAETLLGVPVPVSRIAASMSDGDLAICLKLRGRPPEGVILSRQEVEAIGYDLVMLRASDPERRRRRAAMLAQVADLLALPDDPGPGAQRPGTRRRVADTGDQCHFVVKLPGGEETVTVYQEWGTDAWHVLHAT